LAPPAWRTSLKLVASAVFTRACQLSGIDKTTRDLGLNVLKNAGRIDIAKNGAVSVLGATTTAS
jgi:hypothetical protein